MTAIDFNKLSDTEKATMFRILTGQSKMNGCTCKVCGQLIEFKSPTSQADVDAIVALTDEHRKTCKVP